MPRDQRAWTVFKNFSTLHQRSKTENLARKDPGREITDILLNQETHAGSYEDLQESSKLTGYELVGTNYHEKYSTATYT